MLQWQPILQDIFGRHQQNLRRNEMHPSQPRILSRRMLLNRYTPLALHFQPNRLACELVVELHLEFFLYFPFVLELDDDCFVVADPRTK